MDDFNDGLEETVDISNEIGLKILDFAQCCSDLDDKRRGPILFIVFGKLLAATAHALNMKPEKFKSMLQNLLMDYHENWEEENNARSNDVPRH